MTIRIRKGLLGNESPAIAFIGITSEETSSASRLLEADSITPEVDGDNVNLIDDWLSENNGDTTYDFFGIHYNEFLDLDDNTFSSAVGVASYINDIKVGVVTAMYIRRSTPLVANDTINTTVGAAFTYNASLIGAVSYYWDETTFPNGVDVSRYDRRKISGIITQAGTYTIGFDAVNRIGARSTSVDIIVS